MYQEKKQKLMQW